MIDTALTAFMSSAATAALAIVGWVVNRHLKAAQARAADGAGKESRAKATQTEGAAWQAAMEGNTDLFQKVQQLQTGLLELTDQHNMILAWAADVVRRERDDPTAPLPPLPAGLKRLPGTEPEVP